MASAPAERRRPGPGAGPPITFAHRGARADERENTLAAFRLGLERGAAGLETDAWLSADGDVVLVHDARQWTRRLGVPWRGRIDRMPAERLARIGVPTLAEVYRELGHDYELSIDLKAPGVGEAVLAVATELGDPGRCWLCSPSTRVLRALRGRSDAVRLVHSQARSRLRDGVERHAKNLADADLDVMNLHHSEWTAGLVALFHRFGVLAFAWDVQEVRHLQAMLRVGVDAVYSDFVDRMVGVVAEWTTGPGGGAPDGSERPG